MKMWIIPVVVWVGLATTTLFAPKPDNGFPLDPTKNFPAALDPKGAEKKCNLASWVTAAATKQRCALVNEHLTDVQNAYKGMSPLDLQNVKNNSAQISSSPAWKNLVWAKNNCSNFGAGLGTSSCPLTQNQFNTATQNLVNVNNQVLNTLEDCIRKQNNVDDQVAAQKVLPFCAAQTLLLTQDLTAQWKLDTKSEDKK